MSESAPGHGVYVHAPWCRVRCPYCAFNVYPDREADWSRWADGVQAEAALRGLEALGPAHSVYFGGGTPSLAPPAEIARVLRAIPTAPDAEITLEVNPGTLDDDAMAAVLSLGVNRLSLGVQTFSVRHARLLNRGHTVRDAQRLLARVAALPLRSWSVDLIFGLPDQSLDEVDVDLDALLAGAPPHVSLYGLTFEEGTPLFSALQAGRLRELDEDAWRAQLDRIVTRLTDAGFERYELSNFARPGHRSRHNEAVWRGGAYVGLGPGAHGLLPDGRRTENHRAVGDWLADPLGSVAAVDPHQRALDRVLTALRHIDGLDRAALVRDTGHQLPSSATEPLVQRGLLLERGRRLRLTSDGQALCDAVVRHLARRLVAAPPAESGRAAPTLSPQLDMTPPLS